MDQPSTDTPYREFLVARARDAFEYERLWFEAHRYLPKQRLASATVRYDDACAAVARAGEELRRVSSDADLDLEQRRAGEQHTPPLVVRTRRTREHALRVRQARQALAIARDDADSIAAELAALREADARLRSTALARVRRVHELVHSRLEAYRTSLVRHHPDGARILRTLDPLDPVLPPWTLAGANPTGPRAPESSPLTAATPPPTWPTRQPAPTGRRFMLDRPLIIGSGRSADIVIAGYSVAAAHARVRPAGDTVLLHDLGNGPTYLGGVSVRRTRLHDGDSFAVGSYRYAVRDGELVEFQDKSFDIVALDLSATTDGRPRLSSMSFAQQERTLLAIVGPSGAGKSSLFAALTGDLPLAGGTVYFKDLDLGAHAAQIRQRLGFVPQRDHLHHTLTTDQVLDYADRLRRPHGVPGRIRRASIDEVCRALHIEPEQRQQKVDTLSGGQRKRVSMALELLSKPDLLLLDEPTSGLDPGLDREVMQILQRTARAGCTVIVVTHATEHLGSADQVLALAPGGAVVYSGPPDRLLDELGQDSHADLMQMLAQRPNGPAAHIAAYRSSPAALQAKQLAEQRVGATPTRRPDRVRGPLPTFCRHLPILVSRQLVLLRAQGARTVAAPFLIAVIGAALSGLIAPPSGLAPHHGPGGGSIPGAISFLVTLSVLSAQSLTYSDIVHEYDVIHREHRTGTSTAAVVLAKWLVYAVIAVLQAGLVTLVFCLVRGAPAHAAVLDSPAVELFVDLTATSLVAMSTGMVISVIARTLTQAVSAATVTAICQVALNGVTVSLASWPMGLLGVAVPARWGLAATAAGVDLRALTRGAPADALWGHSAHQWAFDLAVLSAMILGLMLVSIRLLGRRLNRPDRPQR